MLALAVALPMLCAGLAAAEPLRFATYNPDLSRKGPGLLLRDILGGKDSQIAAVVDVLVRLDADVLLLTGMDHDHDLVALTALERVLAKAGAPYPYRFALRPNTGWATGLDIDGDGWMGGPRDAQGFGYFAGMDGMAVLSRLPVDAGAARDFSRFLWRDLPGSLIPAETAPEVAAIQRLSTSAHWEVPLILPDGGSLRLLVWHATPPVFDGPEDRNGRRNHDEAAFWRLLLDGALPMPPPASPFVLMGDGNLDPADGDGLRSAITGLLSHPALQDPAPRGTHARLDPAHTGDPALDTALYTDLGGLRLEYVLPSAGLKVAGAGVLWPPEGDPLLLRLAVASRHFPVWADITLP